jgi:hypothetical protein
MRAGAGLPAEDSNYAAAKTTSPMPCIKKGEDAYYQNDCLF